MSAAPSAAPATPGISRSRLPSLTGLRFLAALAVFGFHVTLFNSPIPPNDAVNPFRDHGLAESLETVFSKAGYLGVSFFFVLSGFVIAWSYRPGRPASYLRRRLVKVFPNHLVVWAFAMVLFAGAFTPWRTAVLNLFLLHSFSPDATVYVAVNPPAWTLCSELLFYVLFPVFAVGLRRISTPRRLWTAAAGCVLAVLAVPVITTYLVPATPVSPLTPVSTTQFWFGYIFPVSRLPEFLLGAVLAQLTRQGFRLPIGLAGAGVLVAAGYGVAMLVPFAYSFAAATVIPVAVLIMVAAGRDLDGTPSFLQTARWQWLGEISFGFYLCQGVTIFYARMQLGDHAWGMPEALGVVALLFLLTLLGGSALHTLVERPAMRRFAASRRVAPSAPVARLDVEVPETAGAHRLAIDEDEQPDALRRH